MRTNVTISAEKGKSNHSQIKFNEDGFMQLMRENFNLRTENVNQLRQILNLETKVYELQNKNNPSAPLKVMKGGIE